MPMTPRVPTLQADRRWIGLLPFLTVFALFSMTGSGLNAQDPDAAPRKSPKSFEAGMPNILFPTMGGKQFWTDHAWRQGWRLQQNVVTQHWRLLDQRNFRVAWGSRQACEQFLETKGPENVIVKSTVVIVIHGLFRSSSSMKPIARSLEQAFDCQVIEFGYASSRASITNHALAFREFIASLPLGTKFSVVGHSMGNIVLRHAVGDWQREGNQAALDALQRVVMLGPPNQGAAIARQLAKTGLFKLVSGQGGMELGPDWDELSAKLATPPCPFGIVAGRISDRTPKNPLVEGESDFVVSVEETKLDGAADFLEVPQLHTFLMENQQVQEATVRFIRSGRF